jgi:hypothetical protein
VQLFFLGIFDWSQSGRDHPYEDVEKLAMIRRKI